MKNRRRVLAETLVVACTTMLAFPSLPAVAQSTPESAAVNVNIQVLPIAELEFLDAPLLHLEVPPPGSTIPVTGVRFRVVGNASAILTAEPDAFIEVPGESFMGKAVLNSGAVGYKIELRFPRLGAPGSPVHIAALPGFEEGPTTPPLEVDLTLTKGEREGVIHMEASDDCDCRRTVMRLGSPTIDDAGLCGSNVPCAT